ncbi:hypothetical protein S245_009192, partial [Arachis hypogaea]
MTLREERRCARNASAGNPSSGIPNPPSVVILSGGDSLCSLAVANPPSMLPLPLLPSVRCWEIARNGTVINSTPKASISHDQPVLCSTWKDDGTPVFSGGCDKVSRLYIEQRSWKSNKQRVGAQEYSLRQLLLEVPGNVDMVIFPNSESSVERDDIKEPFSE